MGSKKHFINWYWKASLLFVGFFFLSQSIDAQIKRVRQISLTGGSGSTQENRFNNYYNGYIIGGSKALYRLDSNLNVIWTKSFDGIGNTQNGPFFVFKNQGLAFTHYQDWPFSSDTTTRMDTFASCGGSFGVRDYWTLSIDSNGIKINDTVHYACGTNILNDVLSYNNKRLYCGSSNASNSYSKSESSYGFYDFWILMTDSAGNKIWDKTYGGDEDDYFVKAIIKNKFIYLAGYSESGANSIKSQANFGDRDFWIIKIDSNGNKIWDRTYGGSEDDKLSDLLITEKGNLYLLGSSLSGSSGNKNSPSFGFNSNNYWVVKIDSNGNKIWDKTYGGFGWDLLQKGCINNSNQVYLFGRSTSTLGGNKSITTSHQNWIVKIDTSGQIIWEDEVDNNLSYFFYADFIDSNILRVGYNSIILEDYKEFAKQITGSIYSDFDSSCSYNKAQECNIPNILIQNTTENTHALTNDSIYTIYLFEKDTAILKVINLDTNLYISCNKDSIWVDMTGKKYSNGINFPVQTNRTGYNLNITSFSHSIQRPGRWSSYQLGYQNNAFDTAFNAFVLIEIDTSKVDSIQSPFNYILSGNILRFNLDNIRPFKHSLISYSIKLKTNVIIGSLNCHRAKIFPISNLNPSTIYDSSDIKSFIRCHSKDTIELVLKNVGIKDQKDSGFIKSYENNIFFKVDTFFLNSGDSTIFKYRLDSNKVYTSEIFNSNHHPVTPISIRHDDQCANYLPFISDNPALNFHRHDDAKEYEEDCDIVRGSYDPNIKSVIPVGQFPERYTATNTELKYRIDFQNTGTDTAFRVILIDTLSDLLDIRSFKLGQSSHPFQIEFGQNRALKFIFDPISLIDSGTNEPGSHGYVTFKIKHVNNITPKSKIENKADIYFDYNKPIRTNTVFNSIYDTILILSPKLYVPDTFLISPSSITIPASANSTGKINITTNKHWNAKSNQSWATLSSSSGLGDNEITVHASANTGEVRTALLTISSPNLPSKVIVLTQVDSNSNYIVISPDTIFAPASGSDTLKFTVHSNTSWAFTFTHPWFTFSPNSGKSTQTINLKVSENLDTVIRSSYITVKTDDNISHDLVIIQYPKIKSAISTIHNTSLAVYPIPMKEKFYLRIDKKIVLSSINIYNSFGKLVKSIPAINNGLIEVQTKELSRGVYNIVLIDSNKQIIAKKIKLE